VVLSSGGMTSRLDKLEAAGLVARGADPADRRGVLVRLTPKGRRVIDAATEARFADAAEARVGLSDAEWQRLDGLLRKWLVALRGAE
jgi:DNA-binding MarR family transcriptional regulator